jgi:hypothetical protein
VDDRRLFFVRLRAGGATEDRAPAPVAEARAQATRLVAEGRRGVRLVHLESGREHRWWPELGRGVAP